MKAMSIEQPFTSIFHSGRREISSDLSTRGWILPCYCRYVIPYGTVAYSGEREHRSDQEEFYQLMNYVDDRDLNEKLIEWENFYNFHRPHGAFAGRTPYEILRERLQ